MTDQTTTALQLAFPGTEALEAQGVTLTPVGALGLAEADAEALTLLATSVEALGNASNWLRGDVVREQMLRTQDGDHSIHTVPWPTDTAHARRCLNVAIAFADFDRRRPSLSWSHHDTVHAMADHVADGWLDRAEDRGWSVSDLRDAIKADAESASPPLPGTRPWITEHRSTVAAISKVLGQGRPVLVHPDGRWELAPTMAVVVDIEGGEQ